MTPSPLIVLARMHRAGINAILDAMVLLHLDGHGPHAVKVMAAHLQAPVPSVQAAVRRLALGGYVRTWKQRPPDGTLCHGAVFRAVDITATGRALLNPQPTH